MGDTKGFKKTDAVATDDERVTTDTYYDNDKLKNATVEADADTEAAATTFT